MPKEEGKDTILGDYHDPLDLRNQSKKNLRKLSETLKKDNSIEEMYLIVDGISMQILFETIQSKSSLKRLIINGIEDDVGAYFLSKALESNDSLKELHFNNKFQKIKLSTAKFLFDFLKKNKCIKKIGFFEELFRDDECTLYFYKKLQKNNSLKSIDFPTTKNEEKQIKLITKCFQNNSKIEIINLHFKSLGRENTNKTFFESFKNLENLIFLKFFSNKTRKE